MTKNDQQILFTALAFLAVVEKDGEKVNEGSAQKVMMLAKLLGDFCAENVPPFISPISTINAALFSEISLSRLADFVLSQLDDEIEYQEGSS